MSRRSSGKPQGYVIPPNYQISGRIAGKFKIVNVIEAAFVLFVMKIFIIDIAALPYASTGWLAFTILLFGGVGFALAFGINNGTYTEFLLSIISYYRAKRVMSFRRMTIEDGKDE